MSHLDPQNLLSILIKHKVPFVVIGGYAVNIHGYLRATEDIDIIFSRSEESEAQLFSALKELGAKWVTNDIDPGTGLERAADISLEYIKSKHVMLLETDLGYLDIFDYLPGAPDKPLGEIFESLILVKGIPFVNLFWLRFLKECSGRPKDQDDLANLPE